MKRSTTPTNLVNFKSFAHMLELLPTDEACRVYLEQIRWNGTPTCAHCGLVDEGAYKLKAKGVFKGMYKCKGCDKRFTVTVKTMFEGSHMPLRKWFIALYIFSAHKKGISSYQLSRDLGITQKTAWFMLGRMREAFKVKSIEAPMTGKIQADESYFGGKTRNMHEWKRDIVHAAGSSAVHMNGVLGLMNNGVVKVMPVEATNGAVLKPILMNEIAKGATIVTDGHGAYAGLNKHFTHHIVNHENGQFVTNGFHTNGIENFWSQMKRGIIGIYHHTSGKHLGRYCDEFSFRYNNRKITDAERFDLSLVKTDGFRLKYKDLIA